MPNRERFRPAEWTRTLNQDGVSTPITSTTNRELIREWRQDFSVYGETQVAHAKSTNGVYNIQNSSWTQRGNFILSANYVLERVPQLLNLFGSNNELDWSHLPTSSKFNALVIALEFDDNINAIQRAMKHDLDVGTIAYGFVPLISDLEALYNAAKRLTANFVLQDQPSYYDRTPVSIDTGMVPNIGREKLTGSILFSGKIEYPSSPILGVLDSVGFHPDLATLWELIPLSFLVDAILPIGDFLESFRQGGWVKAVYFQGRRTFKGEFEWALDTWTNGTTGEIRGSASCYIREPYGGVLSTQSQPVEPPGFMTTLERYLTFLARSVSIPTRLSDLRLPNRRILADNIRHHLTHYTGLR